MEQNDLEGIFGRQQAFGDRLLEWVLPALWALVAVVVTIALW